MRASWNFFIAAVKDGFVVGFFNGNPYYTGSGSTAGFGPRRAGQLVASETTTLPNGKVSQTTYGYDSGFWVNNNSGQQCCQFYYGLLTSQQDYDYGPTLARSTSTQYTYSNNSYFSLGNFPDDPKIVRTAVKSRTVQIAIGVKIWTAERICTVTTAEVVEIVCYAHLAAIRQFEYPAVLMSAPPVTGSIQVPR